MVQEILRFGAKMSEVGSSHQMLTVSSSRVLQRLEISVSHSPGFCGGFGMHWESGRKICVHLHGGQLYPVLPSDVSCSFFSSVPLTGQNLECLGRLPARHWK